jgi:hypothetical protein
MRAGLNVWPGLSKFQLLIAHGKIACETLLASLGRKIGVPALDLAQLPYLSIIPIKRPSFVWLSLRCYGPRLWWRPIAKTGFEVVFSRTIINF